MRSLRARRRRLWRTRQKGVSQEHARYARTYYVRGVTARMILNATGSSVVAGETKREPDGEHGGDDQHGCHNIDNRGLIGSEKIAEYP